jgi:hypothetical protein
MTHGGEVLDPAREAAPIAPSGRMGLRRKRAHADLKYGFERFRWSGPGPITPRLKPLTRRG